MVRDGRNNLHPREYSGRLATTATFRTSPESVADVTAYYPKELLIILLNHVANFLSVGSGWRFDSVQSLAISLCPFRPTFGTVSYIQTPKSLYSKGVVNIQNLKDDFCFLWCIHGHIHWADKHAHELYNYRKYFNELNITGLNFLLKFSDAPKFEILIPTISDNVLVNESNEVFPLYASKHRDRKHHVNLLMISNSEGKFHNLLVRDMSALVAGLTKSHVQAQVCRYCLYCFSEARLLRAHLPDCSIHPEQKVEYPSPDDPEKNIKKFKAIAKTLPVPFVLFADFEASWYLMKKIKRALWTQRYGNSTSLADSTAFASPRYRNLTVRYSHTAEKTRWLSSSNTLKIRLTTSEASCQTWSRLRL